MTVEAPEPGDDNADDDALEDQNADDAMAVVPQSSRNTGDPELGELWRMSIRELQEIIDDDSNPLQPKAKQVAAEAMKPLTDAVQEIGKSIAAFQDFGKTLRKTVNFKDVVPIIDTTSWAAKLVPTIPSFTIPQGLRDLIQTTKVFGQTAPIKTVDFDSIQAPLASARDVELAAGGQAVQLLSQQLEVMTDLLEETRTNAQAGEEALTVSKDALRSARSSARAAWTAAWVAIGSLVAVLAGIGVTVLLSH